MSKQIIISACLGMFIFILWPFAKTLSKPGIDIIPQPASIEVLDGSIKFDWIAITISDPSLDNLKSYRELADSEISVMATCSHVLSRVSIVDD